MKRLFWKNFNLQKIPSYFSIFLVFKPKVISVTLHICIKSIKIGRFSGSYHVHGHIYKNICSTVLHKPPSDNVAT